MKIMKMLRVKGKSVTVDCLSLSLPLITLLYVRHRNESVNDAHDRFIVNAALFYQSALKEAGSSSVLLVTNDEGNQVSSSTL